MSTAGISGRFVLAMVSAPLLMGGACEKKSTKPDTGAVGALDRSDGPVDTTPLPGIEVKLEGDRAQLFYRLLGALTSPCSKSESLRKSFTATPTCKRAPFAARFVLALLEDEETEQKVREEYAKRYESPKVVKLDVSRAPRIGNEDAPIRVVEFYDYACPACRDFKPLLEALAGRYEGKLVSYYLQYPLEGIRGHEQSKSAAQAALAANAQGKFAEMHALLFEKVPAHNRAAVVGYAKELGLDVAKFEADYDAAASQVAQDQQQGTNAGVDHTPTVYFNDQEYQGKITPRLLAMWIDEELAVNR